ncbi:MAG: NADH:flavin oxidoreductase [Candidatus Dadabacteria bacterium]|nr:MAG: NADH:flavin oxidoreductase [Candidatus Dadabacteria bacterium]
MSAPLDALFRPLPLGPVTAQGRLFKTATAETRASDDGFVTDELLAFYEPMAAAGTPLIITGNLYISREGKSSPRQTGVDHDDKIPGLRELADTVHRPAGSLLVAQLNHCGRQVLPAAMGLDRAVSASNVTEKMMGTRPRPLREPEIHQVINDFASAAERCQRAGFDGVQVHAGHGYLINQFLTPYTNRRRDRWGGNFDGRVRLLVEVVRAVRDRCGDDFCILLKLNGHDRLPGRNGLGTDELVRVAQRAVEAGVDGVEITCGHYESGFPMIRGRFEDVFPAMLGEGIGSSLPPSRRIPLRLFGGAIGRLFNTLWPPQEGFNLPYARKFRAAIDVPVIAVGGFATGDAMAWAIDQGECDAVSSARQFIADPLLFYHLQHGIAGPRCSWCNGCIARAGGQPVGCYDPDVAAEQCRALAAFRAVSRAAGEEAIA